MDVDCSNLDLAGFVPTALECDAQVVDNQCVARNTWIMRISCPDLARQITPGQFFMVRDPRATDPMLGRPFALLDVWEDASGQPAGIH
ncbi:MAG: dihydroorotate dehydrogenase electron transfer subunit, partial [Planctomycetota bacterium]|nr:dihydroorotate dehydrogenase electron transfer subunit [Planctomycetota bacterium]